jgi:hypothetical protein
MILSEQKGVLSVCALIAGFGAALALALSVRLVFGRPAWSWLEPATISLCMLAVVAFLVTVLLMTEHTRATRSGGTPPRRSSARGGQIADAIRHCPGPLKVAAVVGIVLASLQMLPLEEVSAIPGEAMSLRELRGFLAGSIFFFCLSFPVIASAALMEGGYGD